MTAKEYLGQAYKIDRQIKLDKEKIQAMEYALCGASTNYENDGAQHSHGDNSVEKAICKVIDYKARMNEEINELVDLRLDIEHAIQSVTDSVQREILERRYLLHQEWEGRFNERTGEYTRGIAEEIGYSKRQVLRLHGKALSKIKMSPNVIECHL